MDHHCPFVGNCIGAANLKMFWHFLMLTSIGSFHVAFGLLFLSGKHDSTFKDQMERIDKDMSLFFASILSIAVSVSTGMMFWLHTYMILKNRTTIENLSLIKNGNPFDRGSKNNWISVFGKGWFL